MAAKRHGTAGRPQSNASRGRGPVTQEFPMIGTGRAPRRRVDRGRSALRRRPDRHGRGRGHERGRHRTCHGAASLPRPPRLAANLPARRDSRKDAKHHGRARRGAGGRSGPRGWQAVDRFARRGRPRHRRRQALHRGDPHPARHRNSHERDAGGRQPACLHASRTDRPGGLGQRLQPSAEPDRPSSGARGGGRLPGGGQAGRGHAAAVHALRGHTARGRSAPRVGPGAGHGGPRGIGGPGDRPAGRLLQLYRQRADRLDAAFEAGARGTFAPSSTAAPRRSSSPPTPTSTMSCRC